MNKQWCHAGRSNWLVTTIGVATSIYMLFMVQALRPYLVGSDQSHVKQPSLSPLLQRILVFITFPWSVKGLVHLESTLATIATYETNVHTLVLTDDASHLDTLLTDWGWSETTETVQISGFEQDGQSCGPPAECTEIIEKQVSANNYTSIIHLEPGTRLPWPALASWALDAEVLEPLKLMRCFYHTTLSPETGEKVMIDWVEPIGMGSDGRIDAMFANPLGFERVSSRIAQRDFGSENDGWAPLGASKVHRHFVSIDVQACLSTNAWVFTREQWQRYTRGFKANLSSRFTTTEYNPSCVVPYIFHSRWGNRPVLAPEAEVYRTGTGG